MSGITDPWINYGAAFLLIVAGWGLAGAAIRREHALPRVTATRVVKASFCFILAGYLIAVQQGWIERLF